MAVDLNGAVENARALLTSANRLHNLHDGALRWGPLACTCSSHPASATFHGAPVSLRSRTYRVFVTLAALTAYKSAPRCVESATTATAGPPPMAGHQRSSSMVQWEALSPKELELVAQLKQEVLPIVQVIALALRPSLRCCTSDAILLGTAAGYRVPQDVPPGPSSTHARHCDASQQWIGNNKASSGYCQGRQ